MDVSVIIVSYNTVDILRDCIRSIKQHTAGIEYEIIVVDNKSHDGSPEMIEQEFPDVRLIRNAENIGFGKANNVGYAVSTGKYTLFLNSDTVLVSNAIEGFYDFMERSENEDVFACGGKLVQKDLAPNSSFGNFPSTLEIVLSCLRLDKLLPGPLRDRISSAVFPKTSDIISVDYIVGADIFLRRSAVGSGLPFDPDFFLYFEETELCFRLTKKGFRAVIIPDIIIIHLAGKSSSDRHYRYYAESQLLYLKKCRGGRQAAFIKRFIMALFIGRYLLSGNKRYYDKYAMYKTFAF